MSKQNITKTQVDFVDYDEVLDQWALLWFHRGARCLPVLRARAASFDKPLKLNLSAYYFPEGEDTIKAKIRLSLQQSSSINTNESSMRR